MSLIKCPECEKEISDQSKICPHCGYPLNEKTHKNIVYIKCPECKQEILNNIENCPNCGYPIDNTIPTNTLGNRTKPKIVLLIFIGVIIMLVLFFIIKNLAKCEHDYDLGKITKNSTCIDEGEKTFTCSLCGETKIENIPVKEHTYKEKVTKEPTFEEEGEKTFTCENCGDSYTESIPIRDDEVVVTVTNKSNLPKDTNAGRYSDRIVLTFDVMNRSDKIIKGVQGNLTVYDLFGDEILKINCDFTGNSIPVGESVTVDDLGMEINQFMDNHVKFYNTDFSDLQFKYEITNIVYDDGSSMKEQASTESMESRKLIVNVTDKQNLDINYNTGRFSPRIEFVFEVYNNTSEDIRGVQGTLTIKDLFGVDIMSLGLDFTGQTIPANTSIIFDDLGFDINQYMDDHVKVYSTNLEDLQFEYEVSSIIYSDGKVE